MCGEIILLATICYPNWDKHYNFKKGCIVVCVVVLNATCMGVGGVLVSCIGIVYAR